MGRITASRRYVTDITGPDLLSFIDWGGGGVIWKNEVFVLTRYFYFNEI